MVTAAKDEVNETNINTDKIINFFMVLFFVSLLNVKVLQPFGISGHQCTGDSNLLINA